MREAFHSSVWVCCVNITLDLIILLMHCCSPVRRFLGSLEGLEGAKEDAAQIWTAA